MGLLSRPSVENDHDHNYICDSVTRRANVQYAALLPPTCPTSESSFRTRQFRVRGHFFVLGLLWAFLNPAFRIAVYFFVFKIILESKIENYGLFLFSGLLIWIAFSECTN